VSTPVAAAVGTPGATPPTAAREGVRSARMRAMLEGRAPAPVQARRNLTRQAAVRRLFLRQAEREKAATAATAGSCSNRTRALLRDLSGDFLFWANVFNVLNSAAYVFIDYARGYTATHPFITNVLSVVTAWAMSIEAVCFYAAWQGVMPVPTWQALLGEWGNVLPSLFYFCTSWMYFYEADDDIVLAVLYIESAAAFGFFISSIFYLYSWMLSTPDEHKTRGCLVRDPEMWANVFNVAPSVLYTVAAVAGIWLHYDQFRKVDENGDGTLAAAAVLGGSGRIDAPSYVSGVPAMKFVSKMNAWGDVMFLADAVLYCVCWYRDVRSILRHAQEEAEDDDDDLRVLRKVELQRSTSVMSMGGGAGLARGKSTPLLRRTSSRALLRRETTRALLANPNAGRRGMIGLGRDDSDSASSDEEGEEEVVATGVAAVEPLIVAGGPDTPAAGADTPAAATPAAGGDGDGDGDGHRSVGHHGSVAGSRRDRGDRGVRDLALPAERLVAAWLRRHRRDMTRDVQYILGYRLLSDDTDDLFHGFQVFGPFSRAANALYWWLSAPGNLVGRLLYSATPPGGGWVRLEDLDDASLQTPAAATGLYDTGATAGVFLPRTGPRVPPPRPAIATIHEEGDEHEHDADGGDTSRLHLLPPPVPLPPPPRNTR